jgi:hypothetical protein
MALQFYIAPSQGNSGFLTAYPANGIVNTTAAQTMMFWMNPQSVAASSGGGSTASSMLGVYDGTPNASTTPSTAIQLGLCEQGTPAGTVCIWTWGGINLVASTGFTAPVNQWTHVAYTCNAISGGNQTHNLYINGVLNNSSTNALQVAGVPTMFYFNGYPVTAPTSGQESNNTQLDDMAYFNRQLSAAEIQTIFQSRGRRDGIVYGLVSMYHYDEASSGNVVSSRDWGSAGNTATPTVVGTGTTPTYSVEYANMETRPPM